MSEALAIEREMPIDRTSCELCATSELLPRANANDGPKLARRYVADQMEWWRF